ncbi:uncharacterized protein LOC117117910 [Anneissia japonica]|uniref:uncharacterized protein LOC117117910 n=1 Tax=Anneissia japonica TaxID=1529436 RepID=UPI0014258625|nr:uncharacterized protein LOC117117910 [Anneissia japonica]
MVHVVTRELDFDIVRTMYWTDSTAVLRYIANVQARYLTFVANRVQLIRESTSLSQWHHVSTRENPADMTSRGVKRTQDLINGIWFKGPDFLWRSESEWPRYVLIDLDVVDVEMKSSCTIVEAGDKSVVDMLVSKISNWKKMKRVMAWVLIAKQKFLTKIRQNAGVVAGRSCVVQDPGQLTVELLNRAEDFILKEVQSSAFEREIKELEAGNTVSKTSVLFKFNPIIGEGGLARVGGRISKADVAYEAKHPVFLPKNSSVAEMIVREIHKDVGHLWKNTILLARLTERYWLFGANGIATKVARKCVRCKRYQLKPCEQVMADLPSNRVQADGAPFEHVGVDYFGPLMVKRGRSEVKRYGVIFTCLSSRAVHLEVAHSLDTDSCINSIRRFMARRGPVVTITSDNGTNLVGAEKELREMWKKIDQAKMKGVLNNVGIDWIFNPSTASHFGGVWERMFRSTRKILYSIMRDEARLLDDEALVTFFCEAEGILNSRPLTTTSTDPGDMLPLTPNMLINPRGRVIHSPGVFVSKDAYARKRWRHVQHLVDVFLSRWRK